MFHFIPDNRGSLKGDGTGFEHELSCPINMGWPYTTCYDCTDAAFQYLTVAKFKLNIF